MKFRYSRLLTVAVILGLVGATAAVAGIAANPAPPDYKRLSGKITADGSSTVGPYTQAAAELFRKAGATKVNITVSISGTGGGFQRFCNGETDLSDASRPISQTREVPNCVNKGIKYVAFTVANDGISIVVNKNNNWIQNSCLTVAELKKIWEPGSKVDNWKDVRSSFPDQPIKLYGPGTDSGTFDFFTAKVNGKEKASRSNYTPSEDDNVLVQGVEGDKGALGYFGYSYYNENRDKLKLIAVNGGKGCVAPTVRAIQSYSYYLARPLFIYAKRSSFSRPSVEAFIGFIFANEKKIADAARYVALTPRQLRKAKFQYTQALKQVKGK
jgi:phosphate transport system substrate-binding protein